MARQDLDEIWERIAIESSASADRVVSEILRVIERLPTFRQFGRAYDSLVPGVQRYPVVAYPYVIYFCGTGEDLIVVRGDARSSRTDSGVAGFQRRRRLTPPNR